MAKKETPAGAQELFGGVWTQRKLQSVQDYLRAYCQIFKPGSKGEFFETTYIDAFAGTGSMAKPEMPLADAYPADFADLKREADEFSKGSAIRALEVNPGFTHYLFIERNADRAAELRTVVDKFPDKDTRIVVAEANAALREWCRNTNWTRNRAVVFLDPFGMQVEWTTIEVIARTEGCDVWILFPIFGVNRMLVRHGRPLESWRTRLDMIFGTRNWENEFYSVTESGLIAGLQFVEKTANLDTIKQYFVGRLKTVFAAVAEPAILRSNRAPLFLLVFAAGNERGAPTAMRIAKHILGA